MGQARRRRSSGGVCCFGAKDFSIRRNRKSDFEARPGPPSGGSPHPSEGGAERQKGVAQVAPTDASLSGHPVQLRSQRRAVFPSGLSVRSADHIAAKRFPSTHHSGLSASAAPVDRLNRRSREHRPASIHAPHCCDPLLETAPRGITGQIGLRQPFRTVRSEPVSIVRFALPDSTGPLQ